MTFRLLTASLGVAMALALVGVSAAQEPAKPETKSETKPETTKPKEPKVEQATFGGGCFWCSEAVFERIPGVKSVTSGFSGGTVPNPTYQMVCTGQTGHAEVVSIEFDPDKVSFEKLLTVFWKSHDPTTLNMQGDDFGTQYRSIILYHSDAQKQAALKSAKELTAKRAFRDPIVTQLVPFVAFYPAEPYHQDYYKNHRYNDYSNTYITPKLKKLKLK